MTTLQTYMVVDEKSDLTIFQTIIQQFKAINVIVETNVEQAINSFSQQSFNLLIIDKALPTEDYNKLHKLVELLHPDAALIALHLTDEDFIRYKIAELMSKWTDAQSESKINFIDNPKM